MSENIKKIDARGLACPAPVLLVKDAIEKENAGHISITVDNKASKENVCLFFESRQFKTSVEQKETDFEISGIQGQNQDAGNSRNKEEKSPEKSEKEKRLPEKTLKKIMIQVSSSLMGHGDDELGGKLMTNFIKTLKEMGPELWCIVFINSGVKLTIKDADVLPDLSELESDGVKILVCGTCLNHFDLLDLKAVGQTTNMLDIVSAMQVSDQVINL